jgi:hypothetical protein
VKWNQVMPSSFTPTSCIVQIKIIPKNHDGPLKKVDDSMIKQVGTQSFEEGAQSWLDPKKDESASGLDQG